MAAGGPSHAGAYALRTSTPEAPPRAAPPVDDPYAADRFTVDPAELGEDGPIREPEAPAGPSEELTSTVRLLARLVLVFAVSLVAFHHSVASLFRTVAHGSILVYVLAVPLFAVLAAAAAARRPGFRRAAEVRVPDLVLGTLLGAVAVAVTALTGSGFTGVYFVWRLDLLMLWLFLVGATIMAFGLHQVAQQWAFWMVLLLVWPFPMRLVNVAAGSAVGGAVVLSVVVLGVLAYGHIAFDPPRWKVLGSATLAAALTLSVCEVATHPQRILWPPVAAALVGAVWWVTHSSGPANNPMPRRRVRGSLATLVGLGLVALFVLPAAPPVTPLSTPSNITSLATGPLEIPGWATMTSETLQQQRFFGNQSTWQRVGLREGVSGVGPLPDGRDITVDIVTTPRAQTLELYPVVTTYPMGTLSSIPEETADLGHGVTGQLFRGEDATNGIGYTLLTFDWRLPVDMSIVGPYHGPPAPVNQRVTLIAVDDHAPDATFPLPGNATLDGFGAVLTHLGSRAETRRDHVHGVDVRLLTGAGRALVDKRLTAS